MEFPPKSEKELKTFGLLIGGDYDFDVLAASDEVSKHGNEMIKVTLGIYVDGAIKNRVFDYLLPAMEAKLRHFCDTVGLLSEYESGSLQASICKGRSGKCRITLDDPKDGYPEKNSVRDYVCRPAKAVNGKSVTEDDIPF